MRDTYNQFEEANATQNVTFDRSRHVYEAAKKDNDRVSLAMRNTIAVVPAKANPAFVANHGAEMHKKAYTLLKKEQVAKEQRARAKHIANLERRLAGELGTRAGYQNYDAAPEVQISVDKRSNQSPDVLFSS